MTEARFSQVQTIFDRIWTFLFGEPRGITLKPVDMTPDRKRYLIKLEREQSYTKHGWRGQE